MSKDEQCMLFVSLFALFREMEIYVQSRKWTRVQQEIALNLPSFFFFFSWQLLQDLKHQQTNIWLPFCPQWSDSFQRRILDIERLLCKHVHAVLEILCMYVCFPNLFPERTALLYKPSNDIVIGKGNPIVIWIVPAVIKKKIKHGFNCYEGFSCL